MTENGLMIKLALAVDIRRSAVAASDAAVEEAQRQAETILGAAPRPGTPEWLQEDESGASLERQRALQLLCLRIELAAGLDGFEEVLMLRRAGATWAQISAAAGSSRQAAHERWGSRVLEVLDRYGVGELGGPVAGDDPPGHLER
ncbi:hypothetical protein ABIB25_004371 [Nakamurella sp. UYEF19]|uniref:hypothetical protein n=1 Tax=Nakamurella sp. UYEF19 TaxID=1756392 RepID=UPI003390C102